MQSFIDSQNRPLALEHRWSGDRVRLAVIDSILAAVSTGERDQAARHRAPTARNLDLVAGGVELRARVLSGIVQRDELVAHEVVAGLQALRDGVVVACVAVLRQGCDAPGAVRVLAVLRDLEPDG